MTALQELTEGLKEDEINSQHVMERVSIRNCIIFATSLLEKEKQQIIEAFVDGDERGVNDIPFNAEQYYEEISKK